MAHFMYCSIPDCKNRTDMMGFDICSSCFEKAVKIAEEEALSLKD